MARVLPQSTADFYRSQQRLSVVTITAARRAWGQMGPDFDQSWAKVGPRLTVLSSAAQLNAARSGAQYVGNVLDETDQPNDPAGTLNPRAFVGVAADGRSLDGLLYGAVTEAKTGSGQGLAPDEALARGGRWLDMAVHTLVADAGRQATQVSIAMRAQIGGYVRMVNPPCCSRCAILAGKWFRYNQGFARHPRCDCVHIPASEDHVDEFRTDPQKLLERGSITDLTPAEKHAIDLGADMNQVVNARRGAGGLRGLYTTEGTTVRSYSSAVRRRLAEQRGQDLAVTGTRVGRRGYIKNYTVRRLGPRPTPEAIYRFAHNREDAVKLLAANGYIVGADISKVAASAL